MEITDERAKFEVWVDSQPGRLRLSVDGNCDSPLGKYLWLTWQARAALPVVPASEPCRLGTRPEPTCTNRHQCWEPCGELGNSADHVRVYAPDALPVVPEGPADGDWREYAKEGETARLCIERHRKEQDGLLRLLADSRRSAANIKGQLYCLRMMVDTSCAPDAISQMVYRLAALADAATPDAAPQPGNAPIEQEKANG